MLDPCLSALANKMLQLNKSKHQSNIHDHFFFYIRMFKFSNMADESTVEPRISGTFVKLV